MVYIYALYGSDNLPRYIGKTSNLVKRLASHIYRARAGEKSHKANWIRIVLLNGERPLITAVEQCEEVDWEVRERHWIAEGKRIGWDLTNCHEGGGRSLTPEQRARISAANKGKPRSAETRAKISARHKGKKLSEDHKRKISENSGGWHHDDATKQIIAAASRGNKSRTGQTNSAEARAKVSSALTGRKKSDEQIQKMSAALKGREITPEWREKLSAATKGRPKSEEWKAKARAAWIKRKERKKGSPDEKEKPTNSSHNPCRT